MVYGGCNSVSCRQNQENITEEEIVKEIVSVGSYCRDKDVNEIILSGLICRKHQYHNSRVLKVIQILFY